MMAGGVGMASPPAPLRAERGDKQREESRGIMGADFTVLIHEETERAKNFMEVFGRLRVNVMSFIPSMVNVPGFDEPQAAYMLDLALITPAERGRLIDHLAARFGIAAQEVELLIHTMGVPILASDCTLTVENPQRWIDDLGAVDDEDDDYDGADDYDRDDAFEDALAECGMTEDGDCMLAGSEYCDFQCPINWDPIDELLEFDEEDARAASSSSGESTYSEDEIPF